MTTEKVDEVVDQKVDVVDEPVVVDEVTQRAVGFGWKDKDKWVEDGGKEEEWVPAKQFLYIGDLKQQVIGKDKELNKANKLVKMMKNHHLNVKQQAYEDAVKALKAEKKAALDEGDLVKVEMIRDRLDEEKETFIKATKDIPQEVQEQDTAPQHTPPPEYHDFRAKNPWYIEDDKSKDEISRKADALGTAFMIEAKNTGRNISAGDVYKEVEKSIRKLYPEKFEAPTSPHSPSPKSSGPNKSSSKVALSAEELAIAKAFDLTPEKYAEQMKSYKGR